MELANTVIIYAWIGIICALIPTMILLALACWATAYWSNNLCANLREIYRLECIDYYFEKLQNEGTHCFRKGASKEICSDN